MPQISADLTDDELRALASLAEKRGINANEVLKQAIQTERLLDENVAPSDKVIVQKSSNTGIDLQFGNSAV